ncbi:MAG: CHRD domain-containing protein [Bacteroidota bacterium]
MKTNISLLALGAFLSLVTFSSCEDDDVPVASIVKEWTVALSAKNENPAPAGRTETGTANLQLLSDNTIKYTITVTGLAGTDALTAAHIHTGNVITNGPVIQNFAPTFSGGTATGVVTGLRTTFIDSLKNDVNQLYFNVHSTQVPGGLVRGQLNVGIDMAVDVVLTPDKEVSATPIVTTATGLALLRLTADKKLYSLITVTNLPAADGLKFAHIHKAAAGANGAVIVDLAMTAADFGVIKEQTLSDALILSVKNDPVYVNAHSNLYPAGIVRGQIR